MFRSEKFITLSVSLFFTSVLMFLACLADVISTSPLIAHVDVFIERRIASNSDVRRRFKARRWYRDVRRETFKIIKSTLVTARTSFLSTCGNYGRGNIAVVYKAFDCLRGALIPRDIKLHLSSSVPPVKGPLRPLARAFAWLPPRRLARPELLYSSGRSFMFLKKASPCRN